MHPFELTYFLNSKSPFGILATPEGDRFEAKLFGDSKAYTDAGGPPHSAGVYFLKNRTFLARLDLMGVKVDSSVWRRIPRSRSDTTTIIHELTHMLTHEMLITLPIWFNEGYAEYISSIPIENDGFRVSPEKVREGVIETFILDYEKWGSGRGGKIVKLGPADRSKFLKESLPAIPPVSSVLGMLDSTWQAIPSQQIMSFVPNREFTYEEKFGLYRTSQLILYYFMHLDGDKGVSKLRSFVSFNQKKHKDLLAYRAAHEEYVRKFENFKKLPGVQDLGNGQIRYPTNLTLPAAPKAPTDESESSLNSGMDILYAGEAPDVLGRKIQQALVTDLGLQLKFTKQLTPKQANPVQPLFNPFK